MANKRKWIGILVMVLVFGMAVVGCVSTTYDPTGTWDFENVSVVISGDNWVYSVNGVQNDSGTYDRDGNVLFLFSNGQNREIGTATMTKNTMIGTLYSGKIVGPIYLTKQP